MNCPVRIFTVVFALFFVLASEASSQDVDSLVTLRVNDLTPQFMTFYEAVLEEEADADRRWELWQEHYGFAAVPPTEAGQQMAREQLENAWSHYPEWMAQIEAGADAIHPDPETAMHDVATLLELDQALDVTLIVFVGSGEADAFMAPVNEQITIAIPVNQEEIDWATSLSHEFAHAVHHVLAGLPDGWERSIAQTVLSEGIAMHASRMLSPGDEPIDYIHASAEWWERGQEHRDEILRGVKEHLADSDGATIERFLFGSGTTGMPREAYFAGWIIVEDLLEHGTTLEELARIETHELPSFVEAAIEGIID